MAVPPAVILGLLVIDVNRSALLQEVQQINLTVASRLRDSLSRQLDGHVLILDHAERILDLDTTTPETQRALLLALVADARVPYLAFYDSTRKLDSVVRLRSEGEQGAISFFELTESIAAEAREHGFAVGAPRFNDGLVDAGVFVPWVRQDEFLGYVGTRFDVSSLNATAQDLLTHHLGPDGQVEIVDGLGRYLVSTEAGRVGQTAAAASPFGGLIGKQLRTGIVAVQTGRSMSFTGVDDQQRLGSIITAPELKWIVGASRKEATALASIHTVKRRTLALSMAAALAAGLVGLLAARRVTEPLARLTRAVRRSAREGFAAPVCEGGSTEVTALAGTFNVALEELERHKRALSRKTQMQVRLARFLTPSALRELLTQELRAQAARPAEPVTVLYADLSTATEVTQDRDPEEMVQVLAQFYARSCEAVERAGGVVDSYSGDAVVGVFRDPSVDKATNNGLSAAREVLREAQELRATHPGRADFIGQAVVALASGETYVLEDPAAYGGVTVSGDLVERAAALMSGGKPGRIMLDELSHAQLRLPQGSALPTATGQYELNPESLPPEVDP